MTTLFIIFGFCIVVSIIGVIGVNKSGNYENGWGGLMVGGALASAGTMLAILVSAILQGLGVQ